MKIKLIALDLDGTTLRKGGILAPETKEILETAIKKGIHVVVATGRVFSALPESIFSIRGLEYIITSNGAHITQLEEMKRIYSNYPSGEAIEKVKNLLFEHREYPIEVFTDGQAYIDEMIFETIKVEGSDYMDANYIIKTRKPVPNIYDFLTKNKACIENINIHFREFEHKAKLKEILEKQQDITITSSMPHNLEIGGKNTSKANAIASLCELIDIEETNVMAVGDSLNDQAMIEKAGIGIAMGNAEKEIKDVADYVTLSNDENGVAYVVKKFVLDKL